MQIDDVSKENDYELYYHIQLYYEIFFRQAVNFTKNTNDGEAMSIV